MSYTADTHSEYQHIIFDKPVPYDVTDYRILCVPEPSNTDLCGRLSEGNQRGVGHHSVLLSQFRVVLVDHGEGNASVERPV